MRKVIFGVILATLVEIAFGSILWYGTGWKWGTAYFVTTFLLDFITIAIVADFLNYIMNEESIEPVEQKGCGGNCSCKKD